MKASYYRKTDGLILRRTDAPELYIDIQVQEGEEFYLNCPPDATHIINNVPVTIAPPPPTSDELLAKIRSQRGARLSACDWTQALDSPLTPEKRAEWATYRQQLRDFPGVCDVNNPDWPVSPI